MKATAFSLCPHACILPHLVLRNLFVLPFFQAKLFAKERLSVKKQTMLGALGITLRVPQEKIKQYARLRGLNGHERKMERRRWKLERESKAEKEVQHHSRQQQRQDQRQQDSGQLDAEAQRRQELLAAAQGEGFIYDVGSDSDDGYRDAAENAAATTKLPPILRHH